MSLARASTSCDRKDQSDVGGIDLLMFWNADRPGEFAGVQPLSEGGGKTVSSVASTIPKRTPRARTRSISLSAISGLERAARASSGTPALVSRSASPVQLSGKNNRRLIMTGTSFCASVSDTSAWQLAVLPNAEAYCGATPAECEPFFGNAVSSTTNAARAPPTRRSAWRASSSSRGVSSHTPSEMKWCNWS